ncbi:MAG: carboxymuconolactone decarboxylase family protein [Terrimicrobiaceae bacterium]|nr:carboxymuconolactone decarboxylase family protein [Terrimicrobiaceae bacterium]
MDASQKLANAFDAPELGFDRLAPWYAAQLPAGSAVTVKQRAFMSIACDVCEQALGGQFAFHVRVALENGATRQDVKEAVLHMGVYGAYPKCLEAVIRIKELYASFDALGLFPTGEATSHPKPDINWVLDTGVREQLIAFDPQYGDLVSRMAGEIWGRPGLLPIERAYMSLAADICGESLSPAGPLPFHANLCLQNGVSRAQLSDLVMSLALDVGALRAWRALESLDALFARSPA